MTREQLLEGLKIVLKHGDYYFQKITIIGSFDDIIKIMSSCIVMRSTESSSFDNTKRCYD